MKVDDSGPGIIAGLNAGCWTVGIAKTVRNRLKIIMIMMIMMFDSNCFDNVGCDAGMNVMIIMYN